MVFLVQFEINLHLWVFQKAEIALAKAARAISAFWKTHSCKLIPNCTRNHMIMTIPIQRSKLTFSKSRLLATFDRKMVAIKSIQSPKKKTWRGGHFMTYYTLPKNKMLKGEYTSWHITRQPNASNGTFSTLHFATVSLRIHVEFLNDERGKEKDRWCRRLYYWLSSSCYW